MRVGYFGPEGTFTHEALLDALKRHRLPLPDAGAREPGEFDLVSLPTIFDTVMAVHAGSVDRAIVPIENSLEGSVNATLDALALETDDVTIIGEVVHPIRHCLIARRELALDEIETVVSHPQATAQCARFIRTHLPHARVLSGSSTADAVRMVAEQDGAWAALGNRAAAERYGCRVLRADVEDAADNETRFVWLARDRMGAGRGETAEPGETAEARETAEPGDSGGTGGRWKTAIVFWGPGSDAPGWLVRCLNEFADRQVNLTRIESRPLRQGLGQYMFFLDLQGRASEPHVHGALETLAEHVEVLRVLGSFPAS